jgi:ketosteroid isomerase-like protein
MMELSGNTLKVETHDIMASDRHGLVLITDHLTQNGKKVEYRAVHVWRFEGGKPVAWYEYPRDLYQYDVIWG